jgi:predicted phosphoribosyltransferase
VAKGRRQRRRNRKKIYYDCGYSSWRVVIGDIISRILDAKFDVVVSRKIGASYNAELALGAVMPDGSFFQMKTLQEY